MLMTLHDHTTLRLLEALLLYNIQLNKFNL